jgi:4-oxalomesaconate hydratase
MADTFEMNEEAKIMSKILVVSAHAADFCTRAGGTLARYARNGGNITVFVLTFGERGESGGYWAANPQGTLADCKAVRQREASAAAACLGAKIEFFDYDDYPLELGVDRIRDLTKRILQIRPNIILTHWLEDQFNQDHAVTSNAVIRAVSSAGMLGALPNTPAHFVPDIFFFESTLPHSEFNNFRVDTYIDISDVFEQKMEAIKKFECQPQLVNYYTHFGGHRGFQASEWARRPIKQAEGFKRYTPFVGTVFPLTER